MSASTNKPAEHPTPKHCKRPISASVLEEMVCEVCLGVINKPKKLDCAHSFCRACLHRLLATRRHNLAPVVSRVDLEQENGANTVSKSAGDETTPRLSESEIVCPTCNKVTVVPAGDVDQLSTSATLSRLLKINSTVWTDADHEEMRQSIRRRRASSVSLSAEQMSPCAEHGSVQEFYCVQCEVLVCGHCMLSEHKMHIDHVKSAQEAQDRMAAGLRSLMQPSQEIVFIAGEVTGKIGEMKKDVVKSSATSANHIKQYFNRARELLAEREAELIAQVEGESMKVIANLTQKEEVVRQNLAVLSRYMDQVRTTLQQPGDMALLTGMHRLIATVEYSHKMIQDVSLAVSQRESLALSFEGTVIDFSDFGCLTGESTSTQHSTRKNVKVTMKHIIPCGIKMRPFGVAVGEADAVIVSDIHNHCVKVIARSGKVMDTITGPQNPQQIYGPVCLATNSKSQLYILDKEGKTIHRFKNGNFDSTFTNKVRKSHKLSQSWGMAVTDDLIYVTDWQGSCIHVFHTNGKYKDTLGCGQQSQKAVLKHPVGIAIMPDSSLVVADHDSHCIWRVIHTRDVVEFQQIGSENILNSPYGVAVTREGYIVATDTGSSQVCLFSPSGNFVTYLGEKGSGRGEFNLPRHVCTTSGGEILVADEGNQRIQIFELSNCF